MQKGTLRRFLIPVLCLCLVLLLSGTALAEGKQEPPEKLSFSYDPGLGLLRITANPELEQVELSSTVFWNGDVEAVRALWLEGPITVMGRRAFSAFTNTECVVVEDLPLQSVDANAFQYCTSITRIICIGSESRYEVLKGKVGDSTTQWEYVNSRDRIFSVAAETVEHGTVVTDATPLVTAGTVIHMSILPDYGYLPDTSSYAAEQVIYRDTVLTGKCTDYRQIIASGSCGSKAAWQLEQSGNLRVFGVGTVTAVPDEEKVKWEEYREKITAIHIDDAVLEIARLAFSGTYTREVHLGRYLKKLGGNAFSSSPQLRCVFLYADLPTEGDAVSGTAFRYCNVLDRFFILGNEEDMERIRTKYDYNANAKFISAEDWEEICRVDIEPIDESEGTVVTNASLYEKKGTRILISVLPNPGYRFGGASPSDPSAVEYTASPNCFGILGNVAFTVYTNVEYRELLQYDGETDIGSFGVLKKNKSIRWFLLADGELFITGIGPITDYPWNNENYRDLATGIVVDNGITDIPGDCFSNLSKVTSVELGEDVATIGTNAFRNPLLVTVQLPASVVSLGDKAFSGCGSLILAEFAGSKPGYIGAAPFPSTEAGKFLVLYDVKDDEWERGFLDRAGNAYPTWYKDQVITDYSTLQYVDGQYRNLQGLIFTLHRETLQADVGTGDPKQANNSGYMGGCGGRAVIPESVEYGGQTYAVNNIAYNAFSDNLLLNTLVLGRGVRNIADGAFYGCKYFTDFSIPPEVKDGQEEQNEVQQSESFMVLDGILYDSAMMELRVVPAAKTFPETYEVPSGVRTISVGAFYGCTGIKKVEINTGVRAISDDAFNGATGIREITINSDVETIGLRAFRQCTGLDILRISSGVKEIAMGDGGPLYGCRAICFLEVPFLGGTAETPGTLQGMFGEAAPDTLTAVTVWGGVLGDGAFRYGAPSPLSSVTLGSGITAIPANCFKNCMNLAELEFTDSGYDSHGGYVYIPETVTSIGDSAFENCTAFVKFTVSSLNPNYSSDYWGALYDKDFTALICYPPASANAYYCVKGTASSIKAYAFCSCNNLATINIPNEKTEPDSKAFYPEPSASTPRTYKICIHESSEAEQVLGNTSGVWTIEYYYPLSIRIEKISDWLAFETGEIPRQQNLYFLAQYPGVTILLDELDYTLTYSSLEAGTQTVTATYRETNADDEPVTTDFSVLFFEKGRDMRIMEYKLTGSAAEVKEQKAAAAFYNPDGKVLYVGPAGMIDNVQVCGDIRCAAYVPDALMDGSAARLKVFPLDGITPFMEPILEEWLPIPTELRWGEVHYFDGALARPGQISWRYDMGWNAYLLEIYQVGTGENGGDKIVYSNFWSEQPHKTRIKGISLGRYGAFVDHQNFLLQFPELGSGRYYFTVKACSNASWYYDSLVARSDIFEYEKPEKTLAVCTDLEWDRNGTELVFTPSAAKSAESEEQPAEPDEDIGGYLITFYFRRWRTDSWRSIGQACYYSDTGVCRLSDQSGIGFSWDYTQYTPENRFRDLSSIFYSQNEYRAGYYAFTVTALSKDITQANMSEESEKSKAFYYSGND